MRTIARRSFVAGAAGLGAFAGLPHRARAAVAKPKSPLTLTIVDVAGNLALTQTAFENYRKANPDLVGRMVFTKAPAPEVPGKLRAQQAANRVDLDMVLTGTDALAAGIAQDIWEKLYPVHQDVLPNMEAVLLPAALGMQGLAQGYGVLNSFCPAGPILEYMPDRVPTPPTTADELLAWTRAHKDRFMYARPANSGPGRAFLMGVPYILGDSNPKDPAKGWDKTWAYLKALDENIEYYPTGTGAVMKELGDGSRDMVPTMTGWDINPRALGIVPKEAKVGFIKGFHFVNDGQFMCVPKGVGPERLAVLLDLMSYMLTKPAQALTYDAGYFYPGPCVRDVPLSMAPQDSQDIINEYGRPIYDKVIADTPNELPLDAEALVYAFRRWDEQIGSKKTK